MSGIATAIAGSAIVGGIASNKASKRASETAQQTSDAQLAYMKEAENRARADINRLFPEATDRRNQGYQQSLDFLGSALPTTMGLMQKGNVGAQQVLAGSMPQIQNAIMGGPIDYSFAQPKQLSWRGSVNDLLAGIPTLWQEQEQPTGDATSPATGANSGSVQNILNALAGLGGNNIYGSIGNLNQNRKLWR